MLHFLIIYKYIILVPLAILEGPVLAFVCGVASSLGYINPFIAFGILILCSILPDLMYYGIGLYGARLTFSRHPTSRFRVVRDNLAIMKPLWEHHGLLAMTSSKLAYGVSAPFIVSAGIARIPIYKFIRLSVSVSICYLGFLLATGYLFAGYYLILKTFLREAEIIMGVGAALFLIVFFIVAKRLQRSLHEQLKGK